MNLNPFKLFDPSYLFDMRPGSEFLYFWPLLVLFVLLFIGSFRVKKRALTARLREFSIIGLLFTFFRDQNIPYLGARFWTLLLFAAAIAYGIWYWKSVEQKAAAAPFLRAKENTLDKYLPRKKKR